jgi:NADH-quinone oxidoreductase subunit G
VFLNGFVIRAVKCPKRRGVEQLARGLCDAVLDYPQWRESIAAEPPGAVWITGGYPQPWSGPEDAAAVAAVPLRIVQDLWPGPLWDAANYRLPSAAWPERAGSFVNANDQLQSFDWAVRPPRGVLAEGQLLWRLAGLAGLYQPQQVMMEVCRQVGYFAPAAHGVPAIGLDLKGHHLATA